MECTNAWHIHSGGSVGSCPICFSKDKDELQESQKDEAEVLDASAEQYGLTEPDDEDNDKLVAGDEFKAFILSSLHRQFPDIIDADNVRKWVACCSELWLTELRRPHYISVFDGMSNIIVGLPFKTKSLVN
jgi:hypothetical protein